MHHHGSCQSIMKAVSDRETVKINSYKRHALRYFFMGNDILHCVFVCVGSVSLEESKGECWFEDQHFCFSHLPISFTSLLGFSPAIRCVCM